MDIRTIAEIYFGINLFIGGIHFQEKVSWSKGQSEVLSAILETIGILIAGIPYYVIVVLYVLFSIPVRFIDNYFQLSFFFQFYLTKKWDKITDNLIGNFKKAIVLRNKNTIKDRIYRHCVHLVLEKYDKPNSEPNPSRSVATDAK